MGSEDDRGGRAAAGTVAVVRPLVVVETQVALERGLELAQPGEVAPAELDAPVLVQDGLLKALDEAVGEGVPGLGPGVAEAQRSTGVVEDALELAAAVSRALAEGVSREGF